MKYEWDKLKAEYMDSSIAEVKAFFISKFSVFNNAMSRASIGWSPAKKKRMHDIAVKALKDSEKRDVENMSKALRNIRGYFQLKVADRQELDKLRIRDAKDVWKILRIENGLPANIVHQTNVNVVEDPEDSLDKLQDESKT